MKNWFMDGLEALYNSLANRRSATASNVITSNKVSDETLNSIFKTGIGNKIIRIKAGYSMKAGNLIFENKEDKVYYEAILNKKFKEALKWALTFGRGIIVINDGSDLSQPLNKDLNLKTLRFDVFSGRKVSVIDIQTDLMNGRFNKPKNYIVNGFSFHHSRVIDLTYVMPTEDDLPTYKYGGISEFELIYNQLINDGVVERASASIIEKNSSLFYKIKGFKNALQSKQEESILKFYSMSEDRRSIYGAGLVDSEDDVVSISQSLSNLKDADDISLRRIALVTGIPLAMLVGESVGGLNSVGTQEKNTFNEMLINIQEDYVIDPLNELMRKIGLGTVRFKENQNVSPLEQIEYESKALDNAGKLYAMEMNAEQYLKDRGIEIKTDNFLEDEFSDEEVEEETEI